MPDEKMKYPLLEFEYDKSIYEAALQLNRVFEDADKAAQQYLENVRLMSEKGCGEL